MNPTSVLVGKKITVYSRMGDTEKQDVGILEAMGEGWLKVKKSDGETLFFCEYNVRMLKPFDPL
jgi:hypothetical protein